jgi:hypothetical protein
MLIQARAQFTRGGQARGAPSGDGDIDRRQRVLVQTKGLTGKTLDAIARNRRTEGAGRDAQSQPRIGFMIGQDRQAEEGIGEFSTAPRNLAKFGRLVQTLARLERQFTDYWTALRSASGTEALAALGATPGQQSTATLGGHARAETVGTGTM